MVVAQKQLYFKATSFFQYTFYGNITSVSLNYSFSKSQPDATSNNPPLLLFIPLIKTFKNSFLIFLRYTNSSIFHSYKWMLIFLSNCDIDRTTRMIIPNRIVTQIVYQFFHHTTVCLNHLCISFHTHNYMMLVCLHLKHIAAIQCHFIQIYRFCIHTFFYRIQLRQTQNIIDQCQQTLRTFINFSGKTHGIFPLRNP